MKKISSLYKRIPLFLIPYSLFLNTSVAFAQIVPCGNPGQPACTSLCQVLILVNNLVAIAWKIGLSLAGLFFAYGAFVIMTAGAGGSEKQMTEGRNMLWTVVIGVTIMLTAWLLIGILLRVITGSPSVFPWNEIQCSV